jgi:hypothetical protein
MKDAEVPEKYAAGWLSRLDMRYASSQEVCSRFEALTCDLGGLDALSYQQRSLAERCVWLEFHLASQERALAEGGKLDIGQWVQANNSLLGLYKALGLSRVARKAETLSEYARRVATEDQSGGRSVA